MNDFELSKVANWPRISIVIPSYNQGQFLEDTICSVISQKYPNLESIVIDGGSQDESPNIINKYADQLAYWISEPDRGQSHAINKGFSKCTGDIVTFLSSDDTYAPGTLLDVANKFNANKNFNLGAIVGAFQVQDEKSNIVANPIFPLIPHRGPIDLTLVHPSQYRMHQVSTFFIRAALEKVGFWVKEDLRFVMDRELLYRVCREYSILLVDRVYGVFRQHSFSKSENSVLPFVQEFASLYLENMTGNISKDRIRSKNATIHLVHGRIKYAKTSRNPWLAIRSLLYVFFMMPSSMFHYAYLSAWAGVVKKGINYGANKTEQ